MPRQEKPLTSRPELVYKKAAEKLIGEKQ